MTAHLIILEFAFLQHLCELECGIKLGHWVWGRQAGVQIQGQCLKSAQGSGWPTGSVQSIRAVQSCYSQCLKFPDGILEVSSLGRRIICDYSRELRQDESGQVGTVRCKLLSGERHFEQSPEVLCQ